MWGKQEHWNFIDQDIKKTDCWLAALACFTSATNTEYCDGMGAASGAAPGTQRAVCLVLGGIFFPLPFLLSLDVANTSTYCDLLVERLNDARAKHDPESDDKITWLETALPWLERLACESFFITMHISVSARTNRPIVRTEQKARWASR